VRAGRVVGDGLYALIVKNVSEAVQHSQPGLRDARQRTAEIEAVQSDRLVRQQRRNLDLRE
jgi:hypothetical protein